MERVLLPWVGVEPETIGILGIGQGKVRMQSGQLTGEAARSD